MALECSRLSHEWVLELSARAVQSGLRYLDGPVTGLPEQAATGELTLLVGARRCDLELARPLPNALGHTILHFGPVGGGTAHQLPVNLLRAVQIAPAAEAMAFAECAGLDQCSSRRRSATGRRVVRR